ncbi:hypothetical protein ACFWZ4_13070 [Frateuria sp. GZRe12]|uniref:hypothetical protein n=1 Tax=Frateuria sp. GZRe12 TaxID=3351533 RepID=UPI003EDB8BCB
MYAILSYGFPLLLIAFEWGLRRVLQIDSSGFIGPTLAAAALSFLVPLTRPKITTISQDGSTFQLLNERDQQLIPVVWLTVLAGLFAWAASCYFSIKLNSETFYLLPVHVAIGLAIYFISVVLVAIKEAV